MPDGIDVSSAQHPGGVGIDWPAVAHDGVFFAAIKATGERGYVNPYYKGDWEQSRDAGIPVRCAYHFIDGRDPAVQAQQFYAVVGPIGPGELVALDVETSPGVGELPPGFVVPLLERIEALFSRTPLLYMGAYYTQANDPRYARFPLWLPSYGVTSPRSPRPYIIHQYGSTGRVAGVAGDVDVNRVVDRQSLQDLTGAPLPAPPQEDDVKISYAIYRHEGKAGQLFMAAEYDGVPAIKDVVVVQDADHLDLLKRTFQPREAGDNGALIDALGW